MKLSFVLVFGIELRNDGYGYASGQILQIWPYLAYVEDVELPLGV